MFGTLLGILITGLIIGGVIVVVKVVLLTYELVKNKIDEKLKAKRNGIVLGTTGKSLMQKVIEEQAKSPNTEHLSQEQWNKLNELDREDVVVVVGLNKDGTCEDEKDITIFDGEKVEKRVVETFNKPLVINS